MGHFIDNVIFEQEFDELIEYLRSRNLTIREGIMLLQGMINFINAEATKDVTVGTLKKK